MKANKEVILIVFLLIVIFLLWKFSKKIQAEKNDLENEANLDNTALEKVYDLILEAKFINAEKAEPKIKLSK